MTDRAEARRLVERGYDRVADQYLASKNESDPHLRRMLEGLARRLPPNAPVLDLGCGAGVPGTRWLAQQGFTVTGVDVSARQLELARQHVPAATLLKADMADEAALDFLPSSFAAVVAFYSIIHVPREEQPALVARVHRWLRPGGLFLATWAVGAWEGEETDWEGYGAPMWWSHYGPEDSLMLLAAAGFRVASAETTSKGETWMWVSAEADTRPSLPIQ
jgi:SAM-dependent methyltransferase